MTIRVHLSDAEGAPVHRLARLLDVSPEDIAYAALDHLMLQARETEVQQAILQARQWKKENLPLWADSACSVHAYEGMRDCEPMKSRYSV